MTTPARQPQGVWWAVQCKPRQESRAQANLETAGVRTFLPLARHAGPRTADVGGAPRVEPLFPRYLFAQCEAPGMTSRIRFARGVARIVGTGDGPTAVDDAIIATIRERVETDGCVPLSHALKPGDPVRIAAGPLKDFSGVFESAASGADRVRLLLEAVHGGWRVDVDRTLVERC